MKEEDPEICIFCEIVAGRSPVSVVYQDERVMVFPTIQPVNDGHLLVIPKEHKAYIADVDDDLVMHIMKISKMMASAIRRSKFKCEGINLFVADGEVAGQEIFHFHMHVYPRFENDGFGFEYDLEKHFIRMDRQEMDDVAEEIRNHL